MGIKILLVVFTMLVANVSSAQKIFINDLDSFNKFKVKNDDYIFIGFKSWYKSNCLYNQETICKQTTYGGARIFIKNEQGYVQEKLLINNKAGYKRPDFDSLEYRISYENIKKSLLIRQLYFQNAYEEKRPFVIDTFHLKIIDTLYFTEKRLVKRIFKDDYKNGLKIFVFASQSVNENDTLHFWVEGIGIIKVVYRDCWRYSFELDFEDYLPKRKNKLIEKLLATIKQKYKDPEWLDAPCNITYLRNEIAYDSRMKTEEMMIEERNLDGRPFVLRIAFENSLKDEHVKVCGFDFEKPGDWTTYFEGKLTDCSEYSCKIVKASSSVLPIIIYINDEKIVLENSFENSPSLYKYLFVSKEGGGYKLYFSNYPKVVR